MAMPVEADQMQVLAAAICRRRPVVVHDRLNVVRGGK
jgi:hypothetical protein